MENLCRGNEWAWRSRWTHWWFKEVDETEGSSAVWNLGPGFKGVINDKAMKADVRSFGECSINTVLTEGLRRIMLYEDRGISGEVNRGVKKAVDACHAAGIRIVHHVTACLAGNNIAEIPESRRGWLNVDAGTGEYAYTPEWRGWYTWCINNPDFRAEYFRVCRNAVRETGVDGLMADEVYFRTGWHNCACGSCREKYHDYKGFSLPCSDDKDFWGNFENPAFRAWLEFRLESVGDFYEDLYAGIRKEHPDPLLLGCKNHEPNPINSQVIGENNEERMRGVNMLFLETGYESFLYGWRRLSTEYMCYGALSEYYEAPVLSIMYNPNPDDGFLGWALRHAHNIKVWATSRRGKLSYGEQLLHSPEDLKMFGDLFAWEKKHQSGLPERVIPAAEACILLSASTRDLADHGPRNRIWDYYVKELSGWCQLLTDRYIQFSVILENRLKTPFLGRFQLVILPNAACLGDKERDEVLEYLSGGGNLIFSHETSFFREDGSRRPGEERLLSMLGAEPGAPCDGFPGTVRAGKFGKGNWVYFSNKPGMAAYTGFNHAGSTRVRDKGGLIDVPGAVREGQRELMLDKAVSLLGRQSVLVKQAPGNLLIKAFRGADESGAGVLVVHILNLKGENIEYGQEIPEEYPVEYPPVGDDVVLELDAGSIQSAHLESPDRDGRIEMAIEKRGRTILVTVPDRFLRRYSVLCLNS